MRYRSRKFLLAVLAQISANVLVWFGKIDPGVFSAVIIATVAAYIAGNVTQRATGRPNLTIE